MIFIAVLQDIEDALSGTFTVSLAEMETVIRRGEGVRNQVTPHHPRPYGGFCAYSEDTAALRDLLIPRGGKVDREDGVEKTIAPSGGDAIAVMSGDLNTGNPDPNCGPQPKYPKGEGIQRSVSRSQLELWPTALVERPGGRRSGSCWCGGRGASFKANYPCRNPSLTLAT